MHPETHLALHRVRALDLRAEADAYRLAAAAGPHRLLRARLGWTLVGLGLRLVTTAPRTPALVR
ncbi:hypothetical protein [Streptomyces pilosus]|uniref:Uncharacterized protein n=1 Tax=Streptomyces pilosus TaxID=28893 RepID=A0A918ES29_9ACTN|nr:hypothetical protein [Streptomyces pilosus]GGQ63349.1 hypothetical protein GCM10010280_07010 [Streptomyces pilosus]GGV35421.1 hypothetical protein GCM10010261_04540 [Streptomyces pilosus]